MYIAHKCIKCNNGYVEHEDGKTLFECSSCDYTENEDQFWINDKMASYLDDLEKEIETHYPYKEIDMIGCTLDLAIGYHIMGRIDGRDFCMANVIGECKKLHDKWQICYSNFARMERYIQRSENFANNRISKEKPESIEKYLDNVTSAKVVFKEFISQLKK